MFSNPGAERALLSILIRVPDKLLVCAYHGLFAEHFEKILHQQIYTAINALYSEPEVRQFDVLSIYNRIVNDEAKEQLERLGGMQYIDAFFHATFNAEMVNTYVKEIKNIAIKRFLYGFGDDLKENIMNNPNKTTDQLLQETEEKLYALEENLHDKTTIKQAGEGVIARLQERAANPRDFLGLPVGWTKYDRITQGACGNDLIVVVAPSKTGKSLFLGNHSKTWSVDNNIPGLYLDTEMKTEEQQDRLIAMISGIDFTEIRNGMFAVNTENGQADYKKQKVFEASERLNNIPWWHIEMPNFTIEKVKLEIKREVLRRNIKYVMFDYLKLPNSDISGLQYAQEYQRLGYFTTCLKDLANICNIPILTAAQANRCGSGDMDESDIGGSYRILQLATKMVFLQKKKAYELVNHPGSGNMKVKIGFQRNGMSSDEPINFNLDEHSLLFSEVG